MLIGREILCSIQSVTFKEKPEYGLSFVFYDNELKYTAKINNIQKAAKKTRNGFNLYREKDVCEENCLGVYGMFEQYDIASTYYYLDTLVVDQYLLLESTNKKEVSVSFKVHLLRGKDLNTNSLNIGLNKLEIECHIEDIPLRRFE